MTSTRSRRRFLQASAALASGLLSPPHAAVADDGQSFAFPLLGDLHFDRPDHHDFTWLERTKPGDISQIKSYCRNTAETTPRLFSGVRERVSQQNRTSRVPFVLQVGDLVEGLCGSEELAVRQDREALDFVRGAELGVPLLFTKGNHDVTGDGASAAFASVFEPYLREQSARFAGGQISRACYTVEYHDALFCCFDAYDTESLAWLEAALAKRTARHCFVAVHPPVVPYGARATWHLYAGAKDRPRREKLLGLLGEQNAIVLSGHLHKFSAITRATPDRGRFVQVAVSSVIKTLGAGPKYVLSGIDDYGPDQIRVEPSYSPDTANQRRTVYETERRFVRAFEYAELAGYAMVTVSRDGVRLAVYSGISERPWTTLDLSKLLSA